MFNLELPVAATVEVFMSNGMLYQRLTLAAGTTTIAAYLLCFNLSCPVSQRPTGYNNASYPKSEKWNSVFASVKAETKI